MKFVKYSQIILLIILVHSISFGYNNILIEDVGIETNNSVVPQIYRTSMNPSLLAYLGLSDNHLYETFFLYEEMNANRIFDPKKLGVRTLKFSSVKNLDNSSLLIASIQYSDANHYDVYQSLEKDYYSSYFSFADTTTGTFHYSGPQLEFLYSRKFPKNIYWGTSINYGIETGLKDVYTQCETIYRNIDIGTGFGISNDDKTFFVGGLFRYLNYQGKYEAVKEYQDAFVKIYFGFNLFRYETPGSSKNKSEIQNGISYGGNFYKKDFLINNMNFLFSYIEGQQNNEIKGGSSTKPEIRGITGIYEKSMLVAFEYSPINAHFHHSLFYQYSLQNDWGKSGVYDVLYLENELSIHRIVLNEKIEISKNFTILASFSGQWQEQEYSEYNTQFNIMDSRFSSSNILEFNYRINPLIQTITGIQYAYDELDFNWNMKDKRSIQYVVGLESLSNWGIIGLDLNIEKQTFNSSSDENKSYFVGLYLK